MLEHHREKKALEQYQANLAGWQSLRDGYAELLALAQGPGGFDSDELLCKPGEHVVGRVSGASLVEDRRGRGTYTGASSGFSIPVGSIGGHPLRYRVGATRGHYVAGEPVPTAIDSGTVWITNRRVIFQGGKQTRECDFDKLIGIEHDDATGTTVLSVTNRQKPTTLQYGPKLSGWVDARLDLALAEFKGTVAELVARLQEELATIDRGRPVPPAGVAPSA